MQINLKSMDFRVTEILKPTKAKWWADIKVGDIITFRMKITGKYISCGHRESTYFTCENYDNATEFEYTDNRIVKYLKQFKLDSVIVKT
jgi:hypothetical protein